MQYYQAKTKLIKDMEKVFIAASTSENGLTTTDWLEFKKYAAKTYGFGNKTIRSCLEGAFGFTETKDGRIIKKEDAT